MSVCESCGVEIIDRRHQAYAAPLMGGDMGYQGACHDCDWRGPERPRTRTPEPGLKMAARADASEHEATAGLVREVPHQTFSLLGRRS